MSQWVKFGIELVTYVALVASQGCPLISPICPIDPSAARSGNVQLDLKFNSARRSATDHSDHSSGERIVLHQPESDLTDRSSTNCTIIRQYADCSSRGLAAVPPDLPPDIISLNLYNNSIARLADYVFSPYPALQCLNLSSNNISELTNFSFQNLSSLLSLDLHNNSLEMTPMRFPLDVFLPLTSLKFLSINKNTQNVSKEGLVYPDQALSRLVSLEQLLMDGVSVNVVGQFGSGFREMRKLKRLLLNGYHTGNCRMEGLMNHTFDNLEQLECLEMSDCAVQGVNIQPGAFLPLKRLRFLDISYNEDIDIENLGKIFHQLQEAENLTEIHMVLVVNRYSLSVCLRWDDIKFFPKTLTYLDARENNLEAVDRKVIDHLSKSLETLVLNGNRFVFGAYLQDLPKLTNLRMLYLNGASTTFHLPLYYPYKNDSFISPSSSRECSIYLPGKQPFLLELPPNLRALELNNASLSYDLTQLNVSEHNSLENLSIHSNYFPTLEGPFYGLHSLKYLDVSSSFVSRISAKFFDHLSSLETLILHTNLIGRMLNRQNQTKVFSKLINLTTLDLTFNDIDSLPKNIFYELKCLKVLLLERNRLSSFNVDVSRLNQLQQLKLGNNQIAKLTIAVRNHISSLIDDGIRVEVDMSGCPINCDCTNIDFLIWMTKSGAFDPRFCNYCCSTSCDSHHAIKDGYNSTIHDLTRQCSSNAVIFFIVGSSTVLTLVVIICAIVFRFRWNLRYMYYAAYLRYKKIKDCSEAAFLYDAFICYAEEDQKFVEETLDEELKNRGLKILLHRRDFTAGEFVTSNIVRAVCSSRKTLVVLTRALMDSHWCSYEIEMAKMEGVYSGRQVLVFIIMENIPKDKLGRDLLYNIMNSTYQELYSSSCDVAQRRVWWDKLASDIKT